MHEDTLTAISRARPSHHAGTRLKERGFRLKHFDLSGAVEPVYSPNEHKILVPRKPNAPAGPDVWMILSDCGIIITVFKADDGITAAGVIAGTERLATIGAASLQLNSKKSRIRDPSEAIAEFLCALART